MFDFNPLEVGNIPFIAMWEEKLEELYRSLWRDYPDGQVPYQVMRDMFNVNIPYEYLPQEWKDKFDEFEVQC